MLHTLIKILQVSVRKHGADQTLTLGHLLNIMLMVQKVRNRQAEAEGKQHRDLLNDINLFGQD